MLMVVSYDVRSDRRRVRLAQALKDYGTRVQFSVFECLVDPAQAVRLRTKVARLIDDEQDSVRFYLHCATCRSKLEIQGSGDVTEDDPEVYVL
jgi:CRISPR-associated protein Cas2